MTGELLRPPWWRLLYVLDIRAADEVRIVAPWSALRAIRIAWLPLYKLLEDLQELRHAHLVPVRAARIPRRRGSHTGEVSARPLRTLSLPRCKRKRDRGLSRAQASEHRNGPDR